MNLDDLKDNLKSQLSSTWSRIEESSTYNQLKDRFENLSPQRQKLTLIGVGVFLALVVLMIPYSYYSESTQYVSDFEDKRALIRDLLKVTREANEAPDLPPAPSMDMLRSTVENQLKNANLLPEQMRGIDIAAADTNLVPRGLLSGALRVSLAKLNLRQIIDLGFNMQQISPAVKMNDLNVTANAEDPRYFDAEFRLVALAVPQAPIPEVDESEAPKKGGKGAPPAPKGNSGKKPFQRGGD